MIRRVEEAIAVSWVFLAVVVVVGALAAVLLLYGNIAVGSAGKSLWDMFDVLGAPVAVAVIAALVSLAARRIAGERADALMDQAREQAQEATIQGWLDRMGKLILDHALTTSTSSSPAGGGRARPDILRAEESGWSPQRCRGPVPARVWAHQEGGRRRGPCWG